jgi:hypothetical protein
VIRALRCGLKRQQNPLTTVPVGLLVLLSAGELVGVGDVDERDLTRAIE